MTCTCHGDAHHLNCAYWFQTPARDAEAYVALAKRLYEVTAERDRARETAVALEHQIARVEKLLGRWRAEMDDRGQYDQLYTAGVVAFLEHALADEVSAA